MAAPWYGQEHRRIRAALLASGTWVGAPCPRCHEPMWPGDRLDLDHETDDRGRRTGRYNGLSHRSCNRRVNAWGRQGRASAGTPEATAAHAHREGLRMRREARQARQKLEEAEEFRRGGPGREW